MISLQIPNFHSDHRQLSGKGLFCWRLGHALHRLGYPVDDRDKSPDVDLSLNVISITHKHSRKKVLRLAGVYHNCRQDWQRKNLGMVRSLPRADGVIYQSEHAKRMCDRYLGTYHGPWTIIPNGADPLFYAFVPPLATNRNIVLTFSRWRPHKRLLDTIESFLLADIPAGELVVAGDMTLCGVPEVCLRQFAAKPSIKFVGVLDQIELAMHLRAAKAVIHLCWFDGCPNSVVEALVAGVPVITNNVGGTPELIRIAGGIITEIDRPYGGEPIDLYHPPPIDRQQVARAICDCLDEGRRPTIDASALHIDAIARRYADFFEKVHHG